MKKTTAQVVKKSVIFNNSPIQDNPQPHVDVPPSHDMTPRFKPLAEKYMLYTQHELSLLLPVIRLRSSEASMARSSSEAMFS